MGKQSILMPNGPKATFSYASVSQLAKLELSQCNRTESVCKFASLIDESGGSQKWSL